MELVYLALCRKRVSFAVLAESVFTELGTDDLDVLCLDLEGVLIPGIWLGVAARTGVAALEKTTRDIPVYDDLMRSRLDTLAEHDISLTLIEEVISSLDPLRGPR